MQKDALKEKLVVDVKEVISDAEALLKLTAEDLSEKAKEARTKLSARLEQAKVQLSETQGAVREKAVAGAKETDRIIRSHPYESLGIAFGVGILLGVVLNRR